MVKFAATLLLLSVAGTCALGIVKSRMAPIKQMKEAVEQLQASVTLAVQEGRRLDGHDGGMAMMMNPACQEACPGLKDFVMTMMEGMMGTSTAPPPGTEMQAMMGMMCPHVDAIGCMATAEKCQPGGTRRLDAHEGGDMDPMAMLPCICACPAFMSMMGGMGGERRLDAHMENDASMKAMCDNPEGTIGCLMSHESCGAMKSMMVQSMPGASEENAMGYVGLTCDFAKLDCEKKQEDMGSCPGGEEAQNKFNEKGCEKPDTDKKTCCPEAEKQVECMGKECMKISFALASMSPEPDAQAMMGSMLEIAKACPGTEMPKTDSEIDQVVAEKAAAMAPAPPPPPPPPPPPSPSPSPSSGSGGDTAKDDAGGETDGALQAIPVVGMVAAVLTSVTLGTF